jgi:hypothetical protein
MLFLPSFLLSFPPLKHFFIRRDIKVIEAIEI